MNAGPKLPSPPEPPPIRRRILIYRHQWLALFALVAILVAALAGIFGQRSETLDAAAAGIEAQLLLPRVFRYRQLAQLRLTVTNRSHSSIDSIFSLANSIIGACWSSPPASSPIGCHAWPV
jgi:hypothetical protein